MKPAQTPRLTQKLSLLAVPFLLALSSNVTLAKTPTSPLESVLGRFLVHETEAGSRVIRPLLENPSAKVEIERRIQRIEESLLEARRSRYGKNSKQGKAITEISADERTILNEVAQREFALQSEHLPESGSGEIHFVEKTKDGSLSGTQEEFLTRQVPEGEIAVTETPAENAPLEIQARGKRNLVEWYKESQACIARRPKHQNKTIEVRNLLQQMGISATMTTLGTFARAGYAHIDLRNFALDMIMSLLSTGVSMSWMKASDLMEVRWVKVYSWGYGKTMLDAAIYRYSPVAHSQGISADEAAQRRFEFNMAWTTQTSWTSPLIYTILNGTECMISEEHGFQVGNNFGKRMFWGKMAMGLTNSLIYFQLRENLIEISPLPVQERTNDSVAQLERAGAF
jgi:hypothetical protein